MQQPPRIDFGPMRRERLASEVSQGRLAKAAGVSRWTIHRAERGKGGELRLSQIIAIGKALGVPWRSLFTVES